MFFLLDYGEVDGMMILTKHQAKKCLENDMSKNWTAKQIVSFQLYQDYLCMPFKRFHNCLDEVLGRPVKIHELVFSQNLHDEFENKVGSMNFQEIKDLFSHEQLMLFRL